MWTLIIEGEYFTQSVTTPLRNRLGYLSQRIIEAKPYSLPRYQLLLLYYKLTSHMGVDITSVKIGPWLRWRIEGISYRSRACYYFSPED